MGIIVAVILAVFGGLVSGYASNNPSKKERRILKVVGFALFLLALVVVLATA